MRRWPALTHLLLILGVATAEAEPVPRVASSSVPCVTARTPVTVGLVLNNVDAIDQVRGTCQLDVTLHLGWRDRAGMLAALASKTHSKSYRCDSFKTVYELELNGRRKALEGSTEQTLSALPAFEVTNGVKVPEIVRRVLTVDPDGKVALDTRMYVTTYSPIHLESFPFDSQVLRLVLDPALDMTQRYEFNLDLKNSGVAPATTIPEWEFQGFRVLPDGEKGKGLGFGIGIHRHSSYYVWKVFLPLILVVLLAWSALWIVSPNIDPYKQIPATCMLALFAFNITASSSLPKVPYMTFLDAFVLACYVFVFLIVPKNTVSHYLHSEGRTEKALWVDRMARRLIPALAGTTLIALVLIWLR